MGAQVVPLESLLSARIVAQGPWVALFMMIGVVIGRTTRAPSGARGDRPRLRRWANRRVLPHSTPCSRTADGRRAR